jgi:Tol biopolymer transport system component
MKCQLAPAGAGGSKRQGAAAAGATEPYVHPRVSPDSRTVVMATDDGKGFDLDLRLAGAGRPRRLTFGGRSLAPIWTRDGTFVTYQSDREAITDCFCNGRTGRVTRTIDEGEGSGTFSRFVESRRKTLAFRVQRAL